MSTCLPSPHGAVPAASALPQQAPDPASAPRRAQAPAPGVPLGPPPLPPSLPLPQAGPSFGRPSPQGPRQTQSWVSSAAEQASDVLSGLRTVEVPVAALQAALLILTELVARPHETTVMREAAREICGVFAGLTDQAV